MEHFDCFLKTVYNDAIVDENNRIPEYIFNCAADRTRTIYE